MQSLKKQRGMTGLGWLTVLFLIGFFAFLALKLIPIYLEHHSIKSVIMSLNQEPQITKKSPAEVRKLILKRLKINSVYDFKKEYLKIKKGGGVMTVSVVYDVREPMIGNVDILVAFKEKVEFVSH
ncbi:DUF4845 domain-containing protein [Pseudomonadota bacterium]